MSLISLLQEFDGKELGEDDAGLPVIGKLLPGLMKAEFQELQGMIPCQIPASARELLSLTRGIEPALDLMDFSGLRLQSAWKKKDFLPHAIPVAGDGMGNYWVVDLEAKSKDWGPVFYISEDPPVLAWQAKTFEEFVSQLIAFASFEEGSPINLVHDQYTPVIWQENPSWISAEKAITPGDPDLGLFVQSLKKGYQFIDLRRGRHGDGFSWGRWGSKTDLQRNGTQRLFAMRKTPGFIQKLFLGY